MAQKKNNSRKINAFSPKGILKNYVINQKVAVKVKNYLLAIFIIQASLFLVLLTFISLMLKEKESLMDKRMEKFTYWYGIASKYPERPDILFNLAKSSYEIGNKNVAIDYAKKALKIDPLFENAQKFLEELN